MSRQSGVHPAYFLVGAAACWGIAASISKRAVDEFDPLLLLPIELAISAAVLVAIRRATGGGKRTLPWRTSIAALGAVNPGLAYALSLAGLQRISVGTSVLLWALEPILITVLALAIVRQRPGGWQALFSLLATGGVILVVTGAGAEADTLGVAITLAGVGACAVYTVMASALGDHGSTLDVVLVQQVVAFVFASALLAVSLLFRVPDLNMSGTAWASAGIAGFLYYGLAFWFYVTGIARTNANIAGLSINLVPVFGLIGAVLLLGESVELRQGLGSVVTVAAVVAAGTVAYSTREPSL